MGHDGYGAWTKAWSGIGADGSEGQRRRGYGHHGRRWARWGAPGYGTGGSLDTSPGMSV